MSTSKGRRRIASESRVKRSNTTRVFKRHNYRKALPLLLKDFERRCAYSLVHEMDQTSTMEVDHFNPLLGEQFRHRYSNLMPSIRHCNGRKSDIWPTPEQQKKGLRFIDPTKEIDYGQQIFEDPETHELIGVTPAARYHIRGLDLNAPILILRRKNRSALHNVLHGIRLVFYKGEWNNLASLTGAAKSIACLREELERMIPLIPPPPI